MLGGVPALKVVLISLASSTRFAETEVGSVPATTAPQCEITKISTAAECPLESFGDGTIAWPQVRPSARRPNLVRPSVQKEFLGIPLSGDS